MVPRVGEHTGLAQALSNTRPFCASASMSRDWHLAVGAPEIGIEVGCLGAQIVGNDQQHVGLLGASIAPPVDTAVETAVAVAFARFDERDRCAGGVGPVPVRRVSLIVNVPGVALVSVAFGPIGLSMMPPVVDQ